MVECDSYEDLIQAIEQLKHTKEQLMADIDAVLQAAITNEQAGLDEIASLKSQLAAAQTTDPNTQALVDQLDALNTQFQTTINPPAPAPAPVDGDVTNADGSVTHADGSVTNADGSVTPAPAA